MGIFFGTYFRSLDSKGRLLLPSKLLESAESMEFYILRGFDGCLSVYGKKAFEKLLNELQQMDYKDEESRAYIRMVSSSIQPLPLDSHNRVLLGKQTLDEYRIGKDITIIGVLDHFEIWDSLAYSSYQLTHLSDFSQKVSRG